MRILVHGVPFGNDRSPLRNYRGPHDLRSLGGPTDAHPYHAHDHDYTYDPATDTMDDIVRHLGDWRPDLLMVWYPANTPPPDGVEDTPFRTVAIASDWNLYYPRLAVNLARYDVVFCDKPGVDVLRSGLVSPHYHGPIYAHVTGVHRPHAVEKDIDVVYIGAQAPALWPRRARFLERLARLSDRYRIRIATGYDREDYARLMSRAHIAFNHSVRGELNLRVFETFACGALAFLEEDNAEARDWFEDGREVVLYNEDNFEARIQHYLGHPEEAREIAARGHTRAEEWSAERRFDGIIEAAMAAPESGRPFRGLPDEDRTYQSALQYSRSWSPGCQQRCHAYMAELLKRCPQSPRAWTLMALHVTNPYAPPKDPVQAAPVPHQALARACSLAPDNAVHAMNLAWLRGHFGLPDEAAALRNALECSTVADAGLLLGDYHDPFRARWLRALAAGHTSAGLIHAEAARRLAERALAEDNAREAGEWAARAGDRVIAARAAWMHGEQQQAIDALASALPDLPFDMDARALLESWLREAGDMDRARALAEESHRIAQACEVRPFPKEVQGP